MKRQTLGPIFLVLFLMSSWIPISWGATNSEPRSYSWQDKLKRGAINIVTSPVEVAREIHITTQEKNLLVGWTIGLVKGLGEGFVRFGAGAIELLTFPFDFPESHKAPLLDPEYVWQKPGPKYV